MTRICIYCDRELVLDHLYLTDNKEEALNRFNKYNPEYKDCIKIISNFNGNADAWLRTDCFF